MLELHRTSVNSSWQGTVWVTVFGRPALCLSRCMSHCLQKKSFLHLDGVDDQMTLVQEWLGQLK